MKRRSRNGLNLSPSAAAMRSKRRGFTLLELIDRHRHRRDPVRHRPSPRISNYQDRLADADLAQPGGGRSAQRPAEGQGDGQVKYGSDLQPESSHRLSAAPDLGQRPAGAGAELVAERSDFPVTALPQALPSSATAKATGEGGTAHIIVYYPALSRCRRLNGGTITFRSPRGLSWDRHHRHASPGRIQHRESLKGAQHASPLRPNPFPSSVPCPAVWYKTWLAYNVRMLSRSRGKRQLSEDTPLADFRTLGHMGMHSVPLPILLQGFPGQAGDPPIKKPASATAMEWFKRNHVPGLWCWVISSFLPKRQALRLFYEPLAKLEIS